jgi:FtsH-binding integral membrane protein
MSFVVPITASRENSSALVSSIIYSILMGVALSSITVFIPWFLLGITFGITALVFGLMALIAFLAKGKLNGLAIAAIGLFFGAGIMSLMLLILMLFGAIGGTMVWLYWVISLAVFAAVMLITIWDLRRIKDIAARGELTRNLSLFCAFILYNDFINIFLRILRIVVYLFGRKN